MKNSIHPLLVLFLLLGAAHDTAVAQARPERANVLALDATMPAPRATINARFDRVSLDAALSELARQSGVSVMYGEDVFGARERVSVDIRDASLTEALQAVLDGTDFVATPTPGGRGVLVRRGEPGPIEVADTLYGRVTDADGAPVADAEVIIDGRRVAVTDAEGAFMLVLEPGRYALTVTKIGLESVSREISVPLSDAADLQLTMAVQPLSLEQVVVTGVADPVEGVKLPFTVGRVDREAVSAVPATGSPIAAIQGKIAGVTTIRSTGQPGEEPEILLRSPTSIQKSNAPMIVVDGVVLASSYVTPSVDISALDIESIEVVKGAAAASLYGSRAAAGVIQIRTRRGADMPAGDTRIVARTELGVSSAPTDIPLARHHYYVTNERGEFLDAAGNVTTDPSQRVIEPDRIMDNPYGVPLYDNVGTFFRPGRYMNNAITLSQNRGMTNFALTLNNNEEQGSLETNDGMRLRSARFNLDHRVTDNLAVGTSIYHSRSENDLVSGSPYFNLLSYSPEVDLGRRGPDGEFLQQPDPAVAVENPLWFQATRFDTGNRMRTLGNVNVTYSPIGWLTFSGDVSYDRTDLSTERYLPKGTPLSVTGSNTSGGSLTQIRQQIDALNASFNANLIGTLGDLTARLNLRALLEREDNDFVSATGTDFLVPGVPTLNVATNRTHSSSIQKIRSEGYFIQTGLDYADRYIADILVRRDGSSLFGPDSRWHTYYRGALAWRVGQESWFNVPGITDFKLRYARGTAGGRPNFQDRFETWTALSSGEVTRGALGNRNLRPSKTTEQEFGVDVIAFDRFSLQVSYIDQVTEGQLISIPVPAVTGYTSRVQNAGVMSGKTWEATLEARIIDHPDLRWSSTLIADRSRSTIDEWERSCYVTLLVRYCGGSSMSDIWGRRFLRSSADLPPMHAGSADQFDVNDEGYLVAVGTGNSWRDGLAKELWGTTVTIDGVTYQWGVPIQMVDESGLPVVEKIGSSLPDVNLGWANSVYWRGFSIYTHMHAQIGGEVYNNTRQRLYNGRRHGDLDQASKPDERKKPEQYYVALYNTNAISEPFLEDGTFLKLRELSVRYNLDRDLLARIGLGNFAPRNIAIGIVGRNLLTLTGYSGFDPEVGSVLQRYDSFSYPNTRTFTGTVEITF